VLRLTRVSTTNVIRPGSPEGAGPDCTSEWGGDLTGSVRLTVCPRPAPLTALSPGMGVLTELVRHSDSRDPVDTEHPGHLREGGGVRIGAGRRGDETGQHHGPRSLLDRAGRRKERYVTILELLGACRSAYPAGAVPAQS
jgi:hypothetical protein